MVEIYAWDRLGEVDRGSLGNNKAETPIWSWLIKVHIIEPRLYMSGGYEGDMGGFSQEQGSCFRQKKRILNTVAKEQRRRT